jgi:hypothetical protein
MKIMNSGDQNTRWILHQNDDNLSNLFEDPVLFETMQYLHKLGRFLLAYWPKHFMFQKVSLNEIVGNISLTDGSSYLIVSNSNAQEAISLFQGTLRRLLSPIVCCQKDTDNFGKRPTTNTKIYEHLGEISIFIIFLHQISSKYVFMDVFTRLLIRSTLSLRSTIRIQSS